jgi:uncharacterized protein
MKFRLRELPETREFVLPDAVLQDALGSIPGQSALEDDAEPAEIKVSVELSLENNAVFASGHLRGKATVACSRCIGPVALVVDEDFAITFLPHPDSVDGEGDVELAEDDLDVASHDGNEVDLTDVLRDHVVLSIPYAPLCREDCKGLCAQCGADLNQGACACPPVESDARWFALKNLKLE